MAPFKIEQKKCPICGKPFVLKKAKVTGGGNLVQYLDWDCVHTKEELKAALLKACNKYDELCDRT